MNFSFYDLIPIITQEEESFLFENTPNFEEFKNIITSNKACKKFYNTEKDLKSFYAQFKMMIDKRYNNSESSVAFSVKIESEKTLNMKKIERKMNKVDVDNIIKELLAQDYSPNKIKNILQDEFTKAINDESITVTVYNGNVSEKELDDDAKDKLSVELPDDLDYDQIKNVIDYLKENPKCGPTEIEAYAEGLRKTSFKSLLDKISCLFKQ